MKIVAIYRYAALVLGLIYGLFFLLMALDSIPFQWNGKEIEGFLIHSTPGILIILSTIAGFKKPVAGFIIFLVITIVSTLFFHSYREISNFMVVSFPALLVSLLFFVSLDRRKL